MYKTFDPDNENQREDYYYSLMLLFVPFRDESSLFRENDLCAYHERLQTMLSSTVQGQGDK